MAHSPPRPARRSIARYRWIALAALSVLLGGCSSLDLPNLPFAKPGGASFLPVGEATPAASVTEASYHAVRQAKNQNSIVLQVHGDSSPVRVLPLPQEKSVYVSNLLEETGVAKKLGTLEATLFRHSPETIGGLPMEVKMATDGRHVRPESDYALRPGDRLMVRKAPSPAFNGLISSLLGF